jgi:hypothetical protein
MGAALPPCGWIGKGNDAWRGQKSRVLLINQKEDFSCTYLRQIPAILRACAVVMC